MARRTKATKAKTGKKATRSPKASSGTPKAASSGASTRKGKPTEDSGDATLAKTLNPDEFLERMKAQRLEARRLLAILERKKTAFTKAKLEYEKAMEAMGLIVDEQLEGAGELYDRSEPDGWMRVKLPEAFGVKLAKEIQENASEFIGEGTLGEFVNWIGSRGLSVVPRWGPAKVKKAEEALESFWGRNPQWRT